MLESISLQLFGAVVVYYLFAAIFSACEKVSEKFPLFWRDALFLIVCGGLVLVAMK